MCAHNRDSDSVRITPEMVEAGALTLFWYDVEADSSGEIVRAIYEAMEEARLSASSEGGASSSGYF